MGTGYLNKVIKLDFSAEWSEDPTGDPIWIVIRNPKLVPPQEMQGNVALNADGTPVDTAAAVEAMYATVAKLVVGWRVYDATAEVTLDEHTGEVTSAAQLLPLPATPEACKKLPAAFINRVATEIREAVNPQ